MQKLKRLLKVLESELEEICNAYKLTPDEEIEYRAILLGRTEECEKLRDYIKYVMLNDKELDEVENDNR